MKGYIKRRFNSSTALQVESFFNNLGLPLPHETWRGKEYTKATEGGLITFLNDAACVIRLTPHCAGAAQQHPHILKPLLKRDCGTMRAELFPGLISPVTFEDMKTLRDTLKRDDIEFWDDHTANCGYLPNYTLPQFPKGVPVVIDVDACDELSASVSLVRSVLRKLTGRKRAILDTATLQDELFGDLRDAFTAAWPEGAEQSDPAAFARAWDMCAAMKKEGLLVANWLSERINRDHKNAKNGSALYAEHCRTYRTNKAADAPPAQP